MQSTTAQSTTAQSSRPTLFNRVIQVASNVLAFLWFVVWLIVAVNAWTNNGPTSTKLIYTASVLLGAGFMGWSAWKTFIRPTIVGRSLSPGEIAASSTVLRPGEGISVQYRQLVHRGVHVRQVLVQLVLRETYFVETRRGRQFATHDHVVEEHLSPGRQLSAGDELTEDCVLHVPDDAMHSFEARNHVLQWFVRVKIDVPGAPDAWQELEVSVVAELNGEDGNGDSM